MSVDTLGGRIRQARLDKGMKVKELAAKSNINKNYLSLVELGKKTPSKNLLIRIAENTGVSLDWLQKGSEDEKISVPSPHYTATSLNLRLLLPILMSELSYTEESIGQLLQINEAEVKKIISKKGSYEFKPSWGNVLSGLIQQMNLDTLIKELDTLTDFFRDRREERENWMIFESLQKYIDKNFDIPYRMKDKIKYVEDLIYFADDNATMFLYPKQTVFESETAGKLIFNYYKPNRWLPPDDAYTVEAVLLSQRVLEEDKLSIIIDDVNLYSHFCARYKALYDIADTDSDIMRIASIIYANKDTMKILKVYPPDSGEPLQDETPEDLS